MGDVSGQVPNQGLTKYLAYRPYWGWSTNEELKTMATFASLLKRTLSSAYHSGPVYKNSKELFQLENKDCIYAYEKYEDYCTDFASLIDVERLKVVPVILEKIFCT